MLGLNRSSCCALAVAFLACLVESQANAGHGHRESLPDAWQGCSARKA
jgi:hypothetical protein